MKLVLSMLAVCLLLSGCATKYQPLTATSFTGGHKVTNLEGNIYRVVFSANGYSSRETAQTYWLYRCAELALEKGYDGFEILSNINLVMEVTPEEFFGAKSNFVKSNYVYIPVYTDDSHKPFIEADIQLLKKPLEGEPPKVFEAASLKQDLEPYVNGEKCNMGNVCEHVHKYIHPKGKFESKI